MSKYSREDETRGIRQMRSVLLFMSLICFAVAVAAFALPGDLVGVGASPLALPGVLMGGLLGLTFLMFAALRNR